MDAYRINEARQVQEIGAQSVADALVVYTGQVPAGKVWTVLCALLSPTVAETQIVWFAIGTVSGYKFPVTRPVSMALAPALEQVFPLVTEGMELKLFPGDRLFAFRAAATAGSAIRMTVRLVESDLPYYQYEEPLKPVLRKSFKHGSAFKGGGFGYGGGGGSTFGPESGGGGGGGGGGEPVV